MFLSRSFDGDIDGKYQSTLCPYTDLFNFVKERINTDCYYTKEKNGRDGVVC